MYIDGIDFKVPEGPVFNKDDWSHKHNSAGLRYEIGTALGCSKIVHIAGGVPCGSWPDLKIAKKCLLPRLMPGEKPAADSGYRDVDNRFLTAFRKTGGTSVMKAINISLKRMGARHESVNARIRIFACLGHGLFRHGRSFHPIVFTAVANLVQMLLREEPLWDILSYLE
eukprot:CRZ05201.1 hypothetical protein [Spongospora subterranea]